MNFKSSFRVARQSLVSFMVICITSAFFLEFASWIVLRAGLVPDILKSRGVTSPIHDKFHGLEWRNEKSDWGAWHIPNAHSRHVKSCFDVTYTSNNVGARDSSDYDLALPGSSILLLGDSFAEGLGVSENMTLAAKLQTLTRRKVLNFGTSFDFGPLQYYLIYKKFASKFPHKTLLILFLPANDFSDNDPASLAVYGKRHRPYYIRSKSSEFSYFYPINSVKVSSFAPDVKSNLLKEIFGRSSGFRLARNVKLIFTHRLNSQERAVPGWFGASNYQIKAALFYISKIINVAEQRGVKDIKILAIPNLEDIDYSISRRISSNQAPWYDAFSDLASANENITFINGFDVLPPDVHQRRRLFLPCDGHWSSFGNSWYANRLAMFFGEGLSR